MNTSLPLDRRSFIGGSLALGALAAHAEDAVSVEHAGPQIKVGVVGTGSRGAWIGEMFNKHPGFTVHAVADYFPDIAKSAGEKLGVDPSRRFTGLHGYKKLLESGVDAVAIETPPYFHPEQAAAAVDAGKHVYLAKPVAVDVPGCRSVEASGAKATKNQLAFIVDFQTRAQPFFIEAIRRVREENAIGDIGFMEGVYHASFPFKRHMEPYLANPNDPEMKLKAWGISKALSGDIITEQNIHTLDVLSWIAGTNPERAMMDCGLVMREKVGEVADHFAGSYQFPGGIGVTFSSKQSNGHGTKPDGIWLRAFGSRGVLEATYGGKVFIRGEAFYRGGESDQIYREGVRNNIATFYGQITQRAFANDTVAPSVASNLVSILGRTAAYKGDPVTFDEMIKKSETLTYDLSGLKA